MWCSCWIAYELGIIRFDNFIGVSLGVLYLILFNPTTLWILKRITNKKLFGYFSFLINLADELRLKQIVYNLLSNAMKFTPTGGTVILSARQLTQRDHGWFTNDGKAVFLPIRNGCERLNHECVVHIAVADTGIGVKREDQERIFKPFEQADGSLTRQYQGTGLGLSLTKRLVELLGGFMYVESEGENRGSIFHCVLPV